MIQNVVLLLQDKGFGTSSTSARFLCVFVVSWLLWRLWKFSMIPLWYPDKPKVLPYWIPFVGHTSSFFNDADGLLTRGREYFGNSRKPFSLVLAGEEIAILSSPQDAADAYKDTSSLSYDYFVKDLFQTYGISHATITKMYLTPANIPIEQPSSGDTLFQTENPSNKVLCHLQSDFYKQQLYPGEKLDSIGETFLGYIDDHLHFNRFSPQYEIAPSHESKDPDFKTVSLYRWCREVLVDSATRTFFGHKLLEINPSLLQSFYAYDETSWKLLYKYPSVFAKDVTTAKNCIVSALTEYLETPSSKRQDASWIMKTLEKEQRAIGIDTHNIAAMMMLAYWVINANAFKLTFWLLAYTLHDPTLLTTLIAETAPAIDPSNNRISISYLTNQCPRLTATYHEVLRLTSAAASVRTVESPQGVTINNTYLRKGTKIMSPFRQFHFDPAIYGDDVEKFVPERFMRDEVLVKGKGYRPFGGGTTYCPGRFVAKQEVFCFVATVLQRFDVKLASQGVIKGGEQAFPRLDRKKPSLGVMDPVKGDDVILRVREK